MENLRMRFQAKVVAIVDLVLTSLGVLIIALGIVAVIVSWHGLSSENIRYRKRRDGRVFLVLFIILLVAAALQAIQIWADCCLLKACDKESTPKLALQKARNWIVVTSIFFIISIFGWLLSFSQRSKYGYEYNPWNVLIGIVYRIYTISVVSRYIKEMKCLNNPEPQNV